ncbi:MAG: fatty acid desaturase [Pseudomonadota bacterium]
MNYFSGIVDLPWWGYGIVVLILTHISIASVTIFLHRHQAHRALDLSPGISHFFRLWLWLTTGMVTKEWVAIHRKHHAKCEKEGDPHSPHVHGLNKVFWEGAELYRKESKNTETIEQYGHLTPDDWIEKNIYAKHSAKGLALMLIINIILFGPIGLTMWAIQMLWIPVMAAGVINGVGHYWGYRNSDTPDESTNILPWGIIIGGEELHNNHHAYPTSAKLSSAWYEFDIGWMYIRILEILQLATVKHIPSVLVLDKQKKECDKKTVIALLEHRYYFLHELRQAMGSDAQNPSIQDLLKELQFMWEDRNAKIEDLTEKLEGWCKKATCLNIASLDVFAQRLRMSILK